MEHLSGLRKSSSERQKVANNYRTSALHHTHTPKREKKKVKWPFFYPMDLIYFFGNVLQFWIAEKLASSLYLQIKWTKFNTNNTPTSVGRRYCRNMATAEWNRIISVRSNGVHLSHSRQVAHVYYQLFDSKMADGDQLGGQCRSSNVIYAGMHRQTFEKLT